jgi:hypothetical protein
MDKERGDTVADSWANILHYIEGIEYEEKCVSDPCYVTDVLSVLTDEEISGAQKILAMLDMAMQVFDDISPRGKMDDLMAHVWSMQKERNEQRENLISNRLHGTE